MRMDKKPAGLDFKGVAGMMLRGKPVYGGGGTSPNPMGINSQKAAKLLLNKRKRFVGGNSNSA